jgi:hypothetical protein
MSASSLQVDSAADKRRLLDIGSMTGEEANRLMYQEGLFEDDPKVKHALYKFNSISRADVEEALEHYKKIVTQYNKQKIRSVKEAAYSFNSQLYRTETGKGTSGKTFSDAIEEYTKQYEAGLGVKSLNTHREYLYNLNNFKKFVKYDIDLADIDEDIASDFIEHLEQRSYARGNINKHFSALTKVFKRVKQLRWISKMPYDRDSLDLHERGVEGESYAKFTRPQLEHLFSLDIPTQEMFCLRVSASTGWRLEEIGGLWWEDLKTEDDTGILYFDLSRINRQLKTPNAIRRIPLHKDSIKYVKQYQSEF